MRGVLPVLTAVFFACAKSVPEFPHTFKAQIVRTVDPETVEVRAVGEWDSREGAFVEAKMNAVWRVAQTIVQDEEERKAFEANKKRIFENVERFVEDVKILRATKTFDGKDRVEILAVVSKKRLEDFLVSIGVAKKRERIIELLEYPTVLVLPSEKVEGKEWAEFLENEINSFLAQRKFEVVDRRALSEISEIVEAVEAIEGIGDDPKARIAMSVGADVYIVFDAKLDEKTVAGERTVKATVSMRAFETTTAKLLGASVGFSREIVATAGASRVALSEAVRDATEKVLTSIVDWWKTALERGKQFLLVLKGEELSKLDVKGALMRGIREVAQSYKKELDTGKTMILRVWFKGSVDEFLMDFAKRVEREGIELEPVLQNRKLIQLVVR